MSRPMVSAALWAGCPALLMAIGLVMPAKAQTQDPGQSPAPAPSEILRPQQVRALPGQLDRTLLVNDNNPEVVKGPGILLSTFNGKGRGQAAAHLNQPLEGSFELFSHHIFAGSGPKAASTLWLGVLVGNRSDKPVLLRIPSGASWLSQPDAPFLPLPGQLEHDGSSVYSGPGGRVAGDLLAGAPRPSPRPAELPSSLTLAPQATDLLVSLPIPVQGLDPLLNGRTLQVRFESDGPVSLATLASIGDTAPSKEQWLALLDGELSEKEHAPSPKGSGGPIIYSRVSGVQVGRLWRARLTDPGGQHLSIGDQPISWPIASLQRGSFGTGQVQSAPLKVFYPNTAWEAHGNYGVEYDLDLPLRNNGKQPQQLAIALESPLKTDRAEGGLRFKTPPGKPIFFRGSVEVRGLDGAPGRRFIHLVLRQGEQAPPFGTVSLAPGEQRNLRLRLIIPADITPVQVLTVSPVTPVSPSPPGAPVKQSGT